MIPDPGRPAPAHALVAAPARTRAPALALALALAAAPTTAEARADHASEEGTVETAEPDATEAEPQDDDAPRAPTEDAVATAEPAPANAFAPTTVRRFADHLLETGDAYRAIGEYQRYLFVAPDAADADLVAYRIALAYLVGDQHDAAIAHAERVETDPNARPEVRWAAWAAAGRAFFDLGQHGTAAIHLDYPPRGADDPHLAGWAAYVRGWSRLNRHELADAAEAFAAVPEGTQWHGPAGVLAGELAAPPRLSYRSPVLAGLLSIVPGLGHMYLGMWGTALSALTWNGAFAYGLYETARTGQWGLFALLAVLESIWYTGTIYGAVAGAFRHNRDARRNWLEEMAARHPQPGAPPQPRIPDARPLDLDGLGRF